MLYSGKLIGNIRNEYDIKLTTLAHGLCSTGQLGRIESGSRSAEKMLFESLYQRMGKYSGRFEMLVDCDEYEELEKRMQIRHFIDNGKYDEATKGIEEYKNNTKNKIHLQYLCLAECEIMHRTGQEIAVCMEKLMEGIRYTYPDFNIEEIGEYYLSRMEMLMAQQYVRYMELSGQKDKAVKLYHDILNCLEKDRYDRSERELLYRHVGYWLMNHYIGCEKYYKALEIGERAYELTVKGAMIMFLAELKDGIIRCNESLGRDMTEERKMLAVLKRMNKRFGVKGAEDFFPIYTEERVYNVNEVIRQRRELMGMTQEELAEGICDVTTISRLENKKQTLSDKIRIPLLQKLHLSGDKYIACVDTYEYKVFEKLNQMRDAIDEGRMDVAEKILDEIEEKYKFDTINSRQYVCRMRNNIEWFRENKSGNFIDNIERLLKKSVYPDDQEKKVILFQNEWRLLENLADYYEKKGEYYKAVKYVSMIEPEESELIIYEQGIRYIVYQTAMGDILGETGAVEEAKVNLEKALDMSIQIDVLSWFPRLTYVYAWNILEKKEQKSSADLEECGEMLEYAYVLSEIYGNEGRKQRINRLCKKHGVKIGTWQI